MEHHSLVQRPHVKLWYCRWCIWTPAPGYYFLWRPPLWCLIRLKAALFCCSLLLLDELYDKFLTDDNIDQLGGYLHNFEPQSSCHRTCLHISEKDIKTFMAYYRATFPLATVLPKMHILEDHIVPWIRQWQVGFGFMGEQGAESIHAYFNSLKS